MIEDKLNKLGAGGGGVKKCMTPYLEWSNCYVNMKAHYKGFDLGVP